VLFASKKQAAVAARADVCRRPLVRMNQGFFYGFYGRGEGKAEAVHDYKRIAEIIIEQLRLEEEEGGSGMHTDERKKKRFADCGFVGPAVSKVFVQELMGYLSERVIGQDEAKKAITGALLQYFRYDIRSPLLLIGGTGCGKTHLINTAMDWARENVPHVHFVSKNVSYLTAEGWSGDNYAVTLGDEDFQNMQRNHYYVMHWDEMDKIMKPAHSRSGEDVNAQICSQIMNALSGEDKMLAYIDWSRVLVICTGAFEWLNEERRKVKRESATPVGFGRVGSQAARMTERELLEHAGVLKEMLGRFSSITHLDPLDEKAMLRILRLPAANGGFLETRRAVFKKEGIKVALEPGALERIAARAAADRHGARSIQTILHDMLGPEAMVDCLLSGQKILRITGKEGMPNERSANLDLSGCRRRA